MKLKLRRGDLVRVIAGNDKGKTGKILRVIPRENRIIVEGVRLVTKHNKPSAARPKGSIDKKEAFIHASNVMLVDPKANTPTRVGRRLGKEGKLERVCKKSGQAMVDNVQT